MIELEGRVGILATLASPRPLLRTAAKFALLRHSRIEGFYDTVAGAVRTGNSTVGLTPIGQIPIRSS